jgi:hypothetical protein
MQVRMMWGLSSTFTGGTHAPTTSSLGSNRATVGTSVSATLFGVLVLKDDFSASTTIIVSPWLIEQSLTPEFGTN